MYLSSPVAVNLARKAKKTRRLTRSEVQAIERFAAHMVKVVGTKSIVTKVPQSELTKLKVPEEIVINGDSAELVVRGKWLVDNVTGRCVGKWDDGGELLTVFPNPVILVTDAARVVSELCRSHP